MKKLKVQLTKKKAQELEQKIRNQSFTFDDFLDQMNQMKNLGPIEDLLAMVPGMNNKMLKGINVDQKDFSRVEAIITSMTKEERQKPDIIDVSRKKRIALGSGVQVTEVNKLLKQFKELKKMMKQFSNMGNKMKKGKFKLPFKF